MTVISHAQDDTHPAGTSPTVASSSNAQKTVASKTVAFKGKASRTAIATGPALLPWTADASISSMAGRLTLPSSLLHFAKARFRRAWNGRQLNCRGLRRSLADARHVVVCVVRNEAHRLAFFLDYYRKLGFDHLVVIDNGSTDGSAAILSAMDDVSHIEAVGSYKNARYGNDWVNAVINRFCRDKWVLYVDADEFLVFPHSDRQPIGALTAHMERCGAASLRTVMVDMYSAGQVPDNICNPGQDPLEICPLFDAGGYFFDSDAPDGTTWIKGGVRGRMFFADSIWSGPALNKVPLVHVGAERLYLKSSHQLWPLKLNSAWPDRERTVTGALLHFKFLSGFTQTVSDAASVSEHTSEYAAYRVAPDRQASFVAPVTARYRDWRDLAEPGLMRGADWRGTHAMRAMP